jgi:ATP-dependent Clp protease protease subunit
VRQRLVWFVVAVITGVVAMWLFGSRKSSVAPTQTGYVEQLLQQRVVLLHDELDEEQAKLVIAQLLFHQDKDPRQPITLLINSPGGSVIAGMGIIDTIRNLSSPVRTRCEGTAAGMAAIILAWGQRGERVVVRGSSVSLTPVTAGVKSNDTDVKRTRNELAQLVAERSNQGATIVADDIDAGLSFDPAAAVAYGLADRVAE